MTGPIINSFAQTQVQGQMDLEYNGSVISMRVSPNQATALVAGQAVVLDSAVSGGQPAVLAAAAGQSPIGFVARNLKDVNFPTNARVEIAMFGSAMWMTADATSPAINVGNAVEYNATAITVLAAQGLNPIVGIALDKATASGDLIRVLVRDQVVSGANAAGLKTLNVTATLTQINAGLVIIPGITGQKITVTNFVERVVGAFATNTSVNLQSDATNVIVEASAVAGLTNGAVLTAAPTANVTFGAGFATPLPTGEGLKVVNVGSAATGGTSITFTVTYNQH